MEAKIVNLPVTLNKDINTIHLSWGNILQEQNKELEFMLLKGEQVLYRGKKQQYVVKDLTPSTVYNFELKILNDGNALESVSFRAATDYEPYGVMHITRAISHYKTAFLRKIISQRPILLEIVNKENRTPLISAIERGDLSMVTFLITLGANINNPALITNRTPLMIALYTGNLQIASLLIDKGANITYKDCNGLTGLHYAVDSGRLESVEFAVRHDFDVNPKDSNGWTPLLRAVIMESSDQILKFLIRNGAGTKVIDNLGFGFFDHCKLAKRHDWLNINFDEIVHETT